MPVPGASAADAVETPGRLCFCDATKMAVGLAATALPFARSHAEEAERWLRILRVNGGVGNAMQAIGVSEHALVADAAAAAPDPRRPDALAAVIDAASSSARERGSDAITTEDLFVGVAVTYGPAFEHALAIRGTTSAEVLERVARAHAL
jgi:hypothetical protein